VLLCGAGYYVSESMIDRGLTTTSITWTDDIVVDGNNVQVGVTFSNTFEHDNDNVILIASDYKLHSSDESANVYFSDILLTSEYKERTTLSPSSKLTSMLNFTINGESIIIEQSHFSNGRGENNVSRR
jgi:hypothetical protein